MNKKIKTTFEKVKCLVLSIVQEFKCFNYKSLKRKDGWISFVKNKKILISCIAIVAVIIIVPTVAFGGKQTHNTYYGGDYGSGDSQYHTEILVALGSKSALPSDLQSMVKMGVYKDISVSQMLNYMFKSPSVTYKDGESGSTIITFSGNCRTSVGSSYYPMTASISYIYNPSKKICTLYSDPNKVQYMMEAMAVQLASKS